MSKTKHDATQVEKGAGLARGPALILGAILAFAGLVLFLHAGATPTDGFPDGDVTGSKFLGFESNGWTSFFTTAAGAILLFAAAQHLLAKLLGLLVGIALGAAAILGVLDGPDGKGVLGLASANWAVELGWGVAAVLLLLNVFAPRIKKTTDDTDGPRHTRVEDHQPRRVEPAARHTTDRNGVGTDPDGSGTEGDRTATGPGTAGPGQGSTRI